MLETANPERTESHFIYVAFNGRRNLGKILLAERDNASIEN
jgi:hypothetical protein